jgi:lysozyme family protein
MAAATFDTMFDRLIGHEGGYSNDPNDPGGETNWGISKRSYMHLNIKTLTREQARQIYLKDFWRRIHADTLPDGVAWQVFDFAVNSGIETAVRYLQRAYVVADDGYWGPVSQQAADATSETDAIMRLIGERLDFNTRLKNWPHAGKGWARRAAQNLRYGAEDS